MIAFLNLKVKTRSNRKIDVRYELLEPPSLKTMHHAAISVNSLKKKFGSSTHVSELDVWLEHRAVSVCFFSSVAGL